MKKITTISGAAAIIATLSACPPIIIPPKPPTVNPPGSAASADCAITPQDSSTEVAISVVCTSDKVATISASR